MRVEMTSVALTFLLATAAPALAQGGGYYDSGNQYNRQSTDQNRYGYTSPLQQHLQSRPTYPGDWQRNEGQQAYDQQNYGQQNYGPPNYGSQSYGENYRPQQWGTPWQMQRGQMQQGSMQQGPMQQGMQGGYPWMHMQSSQMGPSAQSNQKVVTSTTSGQIKNSLESSGFKNVSVVPQNFLIRATAPDGSRVVMQVSPDALYGVVVNPSEQASSSGTGGGTHSGDSKSSASNSRDTSSTGGTYTTGSASDTGGTSSNMATSSGGTSTTGKTGSTASTSNNSGTGTDSTQTTTH